MRDVESTLIRSDRRKLATPTTSVYIHVKLPVSSVLAAEMATVNAIATRAMTVSD
jgi:hypothetical protein